MNREAMNVSKWAVRYVLDGSYDCLWDAFAWVETPQGVRHWEDVFLEKTTLTAEDRAFLESLLEDGE